MEEQGSGQGDGGGVSKGNRLRPLREMVNNGEEMSESPRIWQRTNDVHVGVAEMGIRRREGLERGFMVAMDFGTLTMDARASPITSISSHPTPNELVMKEASGGANPWVSKVVDGVAGLFASNA